MDIKSVADGKRIESAIDELLSGEFVDRDVTPLSARNPFARRDFNDVCVAVALPSRVVMVPNGWQALTGSCDRYRGGKVHRDGAKVLNDDEVNISESSRDHFAESFDLRFGCCVGPMEASGAIGPPPNREIGDDNVNRARAGNGSNIESGTMQRGDPGIGHDGHSIGTAETKRKHSARGH